MAAMKHAGVTSVAIILLLAVTWGDARLLLQREDGSTEERCSSTHPYVGFTGEFNTRFHELAGTLTVLDDCSFKIDGFSHDGLGPAVYWWGSDDVDLSRNALRSGVRMVSEEVPFGDGMGTYYGTLSPGMTWDDAKVLYAWCEAFDSNFGEVLLGPGPVGGQDEPDDMMKAGEEEESVDCDALVMDRCMELIPGVFSISWKVEGDTVTMMYDGQLPEDDVGGSYMAFGFADPSLPAGAPQMVGSDVVVAGVVPGQGPFAMDYYITSRSQCNYNTGQSAGVCPDAGLADDAAADHAKLLCSSTTGGSTRVAFTRKIYQGTPFDNAWAVQQPARASFAVGPLSDASTKELPIVLYHRPMNGVSMAADFDFTFSLSESGDVCLPAEDGAPEDMETMETTEAIATIPQIQPLAVVSDESTFVVTTGPNPNYPNGEAWGLSYRMNGLETPIILWKPGQTFIFVVQAGPGHPLYITDDIIGGNSNPQQTVYAGGPEAHGTESKPYTLIWTPDEKTPDVVYYQCWIHQKLGWKIMKDTGSAMTGTLKFP